MNYKYSTLALAVAAMLTGCGADDNTSINDGNTNVYPPVVKGDVTIPTLHVNGNAKGIYQYFDPNPIARDEGESLYRWIDSTDTVLSTEQTLFLEYSYLGENLRFCVQPVAKDTTNQNNVGVEECSDAGEVLDALGEKPVADTVALDNTAPTVGETLTATYNYSHPDNTAEGSSTYSWYADNSQIAGQSTKTLTLLPAETENKAVKFCVIPTTAETYPVQGDEVCSDATAAVLPIVGTAPEVTNVAIAGSPYVNSDLTGSYDYSDDDLDPEGQSNLVWKRDGVDINGATLPAYTTTASDNGTDLTFCVEPVSQTGDPQVGTEVCSSPMSITTKTEVAPVASNVAVSIKSGGMAESGEILVASYTYTQQDGSNEKDSVGQWYVDTVATAQPCVTAQACEYTLTNTDIGKSLSFGVKPVTEFGTEGTEVKSSDTLINGIKISGALELNKQLTAVIYGYTGDASTNGHWKVDTSNQDGPAGNGTLTSQGTGLTYTIGTRVGETLVTDTNGNGFIDDHDTQIDPIGIDSAGAYIGKDIEFCLTTDANGEKCANPADFTDVTGGLFVTVDSAVKRVIEPVRELVVNVDTPDFHTYHRPLTVTEATDSSLGFGEDIPVNSDEYVANGIRWALFKHKENNIDKTDIYGANNADVNNPDIAVKVCRNLYSTAGNMGDWLMPLSYKTNGTYDTNYFDHANSNNINAGAPNDYKNALKQISTDYIVGADDTLSATFGWPVGNNNVAFPGASIHIAKGQFHTTRFNGGNTTTRDASLPQLIICAK